MKSNWLAYVIGKKKEVYKSEPGSKYKDIYKPKIIDGTVELVKAGKTCFYDYIQSFKDSCDINVLIKRYQMGDTAALMSGNTFFGDVTEMPATFAEMLQVSLDCEHFFNNLPADQKEKYDNSFTKFISDFGTDKFLDVLGIKKEQSVEKPVENEVKVDE